MNWSNSGKRKFQEGPTADGDRQPQQRDSVTASKICALCKPRAVHMKITAQTPFSRGTERGWERPWPIEGPANLIVAFH
jgi:hypothetical protein